VSKNQQNNYVARYWEKASEGKVVCKLCPRACVISEGQRGFCFVRQNIDGQLISTTYGRSSGFCIDPIEKKPLNHFYPGSSILSFGTAGCNLGCKFCQNWDLSKSREMDRLGETASPKAIADAAKKNGCKSVAFTYNDPIIFAEYAMDIADACHALDIKTAAVTSGYISPEARTDFFSKIDSANVDLKAFTEDFYKNLCLGSLDPVLDTLIYLKHKTDVWLEISTLIIPGENDSEKEISAMTEWIVNELGTDVPIHFTAFHPDYKLLTSTPTPPKTLSRARDIALEKGINHVYTGNVRDKNGGSTYCSKCNELLIERDWYILGKYNLKNKNHCSHCDEVCAGVFEETPGSWGSKRKPISM